MALELVILLKNPIMTKRVVWELFDHSLPLLSFDLKPEFLNSYLLYVHQSILTIPQDQMDALMRRIAHVLLTKSKKIHLKHDDSKLYKKSLLTELAIYLRKWQTYSWVVTKQDSLTEEQLLKQKEQKAILDKREVQNLKLTSSKTMILTKSLKPTEPKTNDKAALMKSSCSCSETSTLSPEQTNENSGLESLLLSWLAVMRLWQVHQRSRRQT